MWGLSDHIHAAHQKSEAENVSLSSSESRLLRGIALCRCLWLRQENCVCSVRVCVCIWVFIKRRWMRQCLSVPVRMCVCECVFKMTQGVVALINRTAYGALLFGNHEWQVSRGINSECRACWGVGGSNGRALLNDLICARACVCVCVCMSISTLRQYSTALCRWMWNRSRRLAALYKYIITILSRSSAQSGSEHNVSSCLGARFSSLLRSDWKMNMLLTVPPPLTPSTFHWHPNTQTPSVLQC